MSYQLRPHPAEVAVEATGPTLEGAFSATANGMAAAMASEPPPDNGDRFTVSADGNDRKALLFDYLSTLIVERDTRGVLPVDNTVDISTNTETWQLDGSALGVPLSQVTARDLKAVTYSEMAIEQTDEGWRIYVVFDV